MSNDRNIEFSPSPTLPQGIDFTPDVGYGAGGRSDASHADGGPLDHAKQTAQRLVSTAQQRASEQVHSRFDEQKMRAAEYASSVAETLRGTTQQFEGNEGITRYINQAADRVENLATYLHDREMNEIVGQVEDFARRQPVAFLGGAFALGVLGARFLKSSQGHSRHAHHLREEWAAHDPTARVMDPERDAVGRPEAPGYAPPSERAGSDYQAGPRSL